MYREAAIQKIFQNMFNRSLLKITTVYSFFRYYFFISILDSYRLVSETATPRGPSYKPINDENSK
jgi:hypothetical protein